MPRDLVKTHAWSVAIHGAVGLGLLSIPVARHMARTEETVELQIVHVSLPAPAAEAAPAPAPPPPPEAVPETPRPPRVPERARLARVEEARPFQEDAPRGAGTREAPPEVEAVPAPTTPLPELAMETTVGAGSGDYVSTSSGEGALPLPRGPGGGRGGTGSGTGRQGDAVTGQGGRDVKVSPDWEITRMPEPLNDRAFEPAYPPEARREGREAVVVLRLSIDPTGHVAGVEVVSSPRGYGFEKAAVDYARKLRFAPAYAGTRAVAARIEWSVHFYVRN